MFGEAIERAEFSQYTQFVFRKRHTPFEIVQRFKCSILSLPDEISGAFLAQSVYDAKSQAHCVVIDNSATPIRLRDADRFNLQTVPLRIFYDRGRRVKTHRLIVNEAGVKF